MTYKKIEKKFGNYESARKHIYGKKGSYIIAMIPNDKKGRFQIQKEYF